MTHDDLEQLKINSFAKHSLDCRDAVFEIRVSAGHDCDVFMRSQHVPYSILAAVSRVDPAATRG